MKIESITYEKLDELRMYLKFKTRQQYKQKTKLRTLKQENSHLKGELLGELRAKRALMLQDKELRGKYEITNQKDWKLRIDELTQTEENIANDKIRNMEEEVTILEDEIRSIGVTISDTRWELDLALAYYRNIGQNGTVRHVSTIKTIGV